MMAKGKMNEDHVLEILKLRAAGYVRRWHTVAHVTRDQNDAEHSAQALSLLLMLHPLPSISMVKVMLWHDMGELGVGDVPAYPALRNNPDLRQAYKSAESRFISENFQRLNVALGDLSDDEHQWIRECDLLELCLFCNDQIQNGNHHFAPILNRGLDYLHAIPGLHKEVVDFQSWIWKKEEGQWVRRLTIWPH